MWNKVTDGKLLKYQAEKHLESHTRNISRGTTTNNNRDVLMLKQTNKQKTNKTS